MTEEETMEQRYKERYRQRTLMVATGYFSGQLILAARGKTPEAIVKQARAYAEALIAEFPDAEL
jgi:hypothetical protein